MWDDGYSEENALDGIIKEQEQDDLSKALDPLISAVNATNEQLRTSNANTEILKGAIEMLQRAITTQGGENIADALYLFALGTEGGVGQSECIPDLYAEAER